MVIVIIIIQNSESTQPAWFFLEVRALWAWDGTELFWLRASASVGGYTFIIQKFLHFTYFGKKNFHNSSKIVYSLLKISMNYNNHVNLQSYCSSSIYYFIFFSLSSLLPYQTLSHPLFNAKKKKKQPTITTTQHR